MELTTEQKLAIAQYMLQFDAKAIMEDVPCVLHDIFGRENDPDELRKAITLFGNQVREHVLNAL